MTTVYVPQPGTIPARVLAWFKDQPPGTEIATSALAETLDLDGASLTTCLLAPIKRGVLVRRRISERVSMLSLGDGSTAEKPVRDDAPPVHRVVTGVSLLDIPRWPGLDTLPPSPPAPKKRGPKPRAEMAHPAPPPRGRTSTRAGHHALPRQAGARHSARRAVVRRPAADPARRLRADPAGARRDARAGAVSRADGGER